MSRIDNLFKNYNEEKAKLKKELLCNLLEELGYSGIDASIEESLFEYGLVSKDFIQCSSFIACFNNKFQFFTMYKGNIKEALSYLDDSFYDYFETNKSDYMYLIEDKDNFHMIVSDIYGYNNTVLINDFFTYPLSINDVIKLITSK